jgi:hypothetical protein
MVEREEREASGLLRGLVSGVEGRRAQGGSERFGLRLAARRNFEE